MSGVPFVIGGNSVEPGARHELELHPARLPSGGWMSMPVVVVNGAAAGPTVWLSAALHGDEINGVEIIRRVLELVPPAKLAGTVLAVPVVNVPGFATADRYMPDRRDLNRCFPGSPRGSLASRFAHLFMTEIVERCSFGVDLHTGSDHRCNLPQVRADLDDPATRELAEVFGAPVALHSRTRDGSLREAAVRRGIVTLLYEGGEAWRFDDHAIEVGVAGTLRVLAHLGMLGDIALAAPTEDSPRLLRSSRWLRSPMSGLARIRVQLGDVVHAQQAVAVVGDAIGTHPRVVRARETSIVIGRSEFPVVHQGDALVHLAPLGYPIRSGP